MARPARHQRATSRWALSICLTLSASALCTAAEGPHSVLEPAALSARRALAHAQHRVEPRRALHGSLHDGDADADADAPAPAPAGDSSSGVPSYVTNNKIGALVVFLFVPLIGCFVPWFLPIPIWIMNYAVLFAAGLFFTLAIEHLLPDAIDGFNTLVPDANYPYPFMIFVCGYFLTWLADIIARAIWERQAAVKAGKRGMAAAAAASGKEDTAALTATTSGQVICCKSGGMAKEDPTEDAKGVGECCKANGGGQDSALPVENGVPPRSPVKCPGGECKCDGSSCKCAVPSYFEFDNPQALAKAAEASMFDLSLMEVVLLLFAMCFHAVFEGLAVGLATTTAAVWGTTATVVIHKFLEGVALGTTLMTQNKDRGLFSFLLYSLAFSIMAPIGIAIGIILTTTGTSAVADWVQAIGNSVAAGVFVFVAVGHLMVKAMKPLRGDKWWSPFPKWGFAALGVLVMSLLQIGAD